MWYNAGIGEYKNMDKFTLSTDSTCDLYRDFIEENGIRLVSLTFTVEKNGVLEDRKDAFTSYDQYLAFYDELRAGALSRTSMLNYEAHYEHFRKMAEEGAEDVLHFTISSGLSPTKTVAAKAAADVKKDFPRFNVLVVDPLTATVGQGLLVRLALEQRNAGKTAQEAYDYVNGLRLNIQHYIVADDLNYLKRGGRLSALSAAIGGMLNVKPIISFDNEGKLFVIDKVRGVKKAISYIKGKMAKNPPSAEQKVCIVHTGNEEAAEELAQFVRETFSFEPSVTIMGPVIGSHVGPDAFAVGYLSSVGRNADL